MNKASNILLSSVMASILLLTASSAEASSNTSLNGKLQAALDSCRIQAHVPGMAISVSLPGEYTTRQFVSGTTKLNGKIKVTSGSLFQIGSITKSFVAAIILQLEAEGKLSINDPISKYLNFTKYPKWPARWKKITIKQLLNMTSGIYSYAEDDKDFMARRSQNLDKNYRSSAPLVDIAAKHPDHFAPGKGWHYSATNYILADMIIESVTKKPLQQAMQERLLASRQYDLINTYYTDHKYGPNVMLHTVNGYYLDNGKMRDVTSADVSSRRGAGAMVSNTDDIVRWVRALFTGNVLKSKQLNEMKSLVCFGFEKQKCTPGALVSSAVGGYGLGLQENNSVSLGPIWYYGGSTTGYYALYQWLPKFNSVVSITGNLYDNLKSKYIQCTFHKVDKILQDNAKQISPHSKFS